MNNLDKQYLEICKNILQNGKDSGDRTGTGTKKVFGRMLRHDMREGFPILTTRKMFYKNAIHELLQFLKGDTNIQYLVQNGVNIWVGDCYKKYTTICSANSSEFDEQMHDNGDGTCRMYLQKEFIEKIKTDNDFAKKQGELGTVYGKEQTDWYGINQLQECIDLLKNNPDSRRILVTAQNPVNVKTATLPPCHIGYQFFTEELTVEERVLYMIGKYNNELKQYKNNNGFIERSTIDLKLEEFNIPTRKISLSYNMRSVDWILGQPSDHIVYGLLLEMVAQSVNMIPNELIITSGDTHIYQNHIIPELYEMLEKVPYKLPRLKLNADIKNIFEFKFEDIEIENYISHDKIYFQLSN